MRSAGKNKWLIVGLGNPGPDYEMTRHNAGFMVIDALAERLRTEIRRTECRSLIGRTKIGDAEAELAKPQTFMNLSGEAVGCLLGKPDRQQAGLIVILDDFALPFGSLRIRPKGSHGGHNGLRSIISHLKTEEFVRVRIGIAPEHPISDAARFVLERFSSKERVRLGEVIDNAATAVMDIIETGIERAMARWN